ncbi:HupE/UreJ family protein [Pseudoroseicyclus tamaricis]|uniref:HupE/UreJ family protein n=1 Tax=Pseudoroseicyclus tamaricis TaxID=2705421 RepID=A0A6B2K3G8_9RHOB|nr:HupE/UreJ family protein [Pseudoroseicyclus tamaricis]NDV01106.1 HupE/UreJ family protein [Pseudoroseicyclus tamaricis]
MKLPLYTAAATLIASPALAHLDPGTHGSLAAGLSHPVFGLDHILAMVSVGLWAVVLGGRALWALPAAFVGAMVLGYGAALAGMPLPAVEPMVLASVFILGLAVALAFAVPLGAAAGLVALFGVFHGHAHGGELGAAGALQFGVGFMLATAALHAVGVAVASLLARADIGTKVIRALGGIAALGGIWVALGG